MSLGRANGCHYFPQWVTGVWLSAGLIALFLIGGCGRGVPVMDTRTNPSAPRGTISGIIRAPEGRSAVAGRDVQVVNTETGVRHQARTGENGGFSIEVPTGRYRIDLPLKDGETLVKRPGIVNLDTGDVGSHIEIVLAAVRVSRPHGPAYRLDNGLGSPTT